MSRKCWKSPRGGGRSWFSYFSQIKMTEIWPWLRWYMGHILVRYRQNCVHIWLILKVDLRFMQMCDWQTDKLTERCSYRDGVHLFILTVQEILMCWGWKIARYNKGWELHNIVTIWYSSIIPAERRRGHSLTAYNIATLTGSGKGFPIG